MDALTKTFQRLDRGAGEKRHHAELDPVRLFEGVAVGRARIHHWLEVDFVEGRQQRRRVLRLLEALGNTRAQAAHRYTAIVATGLWNRRGARGWRRRRRGSRCGCGGGRGLLLQVSFHVRLQNRALLASAGDIVGAEIIFIE